ncbi:MAG: hypothetical protein BGO49_26685 [Planctomycetales bacterium 71-10]|nr:MAG: hypothetical protein BGO49_26685 [Planctomycetales bacterium 71-10]
MNDDVERRLSGLTPRGSPDGLRARILRAVDEELARETAAPRPRRRFPAGLATAAALLLSVWLNHRANQSSDALIDRAFGPRPVSPRAIAIAGDIAEVAGPEAGRWALDRLSVQAPAGVADLDRHAAELRRLVRELALDLRETDDETTHPQIPQVGRDQLRPLPGRVLVMERVVHGHDRPSA